MDHITKVEVAIIDETDPKTPFSYPRATYSFHPNFKIGDKISFLKEEDDDYAYFSGLVKRKATHVIKDVHWIHSTITEEEPVQLMVVTVEEWKPKRSARITHRDGN
ncbi:hypothetical protein [Dyadobacter sediminis]|uniref:Uncharacterized protein n=1 Tax=Dyadobacter sediminis TaxID=1493691 RepID=A0A5R9KMK4_9BACT|nr:hypothetical protein [Dyadobacter sediminis]TLU97461.1 hypothetical protein FEM55_00370 [Dyadobacter sediminis]GGC16064.1 hypothetical protein GCM10011325_48590 [Dyadobacter sediminis]